MNRLYRSIISGLFAFCLVGVAAVRAADDAPEVAAGATEHMIPMRDGVKLATNVFVPKNRGEGPWPVVLTRTPYGKDKSPYNSMHGRYHLADYAYVVQDTRGKFRSEGEYQPFQTDAEDGYDTLDWIAKQPWCNGKIGMSGASAMGITSNLAATTQHPNLAAAFVVVAPQSMFNEATFIGGVFKEADVGQWMTRQGAGDQVPERKARVLLDDEWRRVDLVHNLDKIKIPIYNVGGWYDIFLQGNLSNFEYLQNKGAEGARGHQKLLVGPFGHGNLTGDLAYPGDRGLLGVFAEELRWFDYWLKGKDNGITKEPPVKYFMMASARKNAFSEKNGYRTADNWPLPAKEVRYYVTPNGGLSLQPSKVKIAPTTYEFDPANPVPTVGGANLTLPLGPMDQRAIKDRKDYLRFQTEPLENDVTVAGRITAELWVSTDAPDTDFMVKLVDVYPDGYEALLLDAPLRARYRHGREPQQVKMMTPGQPELLKIDLWSTANIFEKGHRIALHVTSSNYPRFEVNHNNGEAPGKNEIPPRIAKNTIHHDVAHPTAVVLPIVSE
jgi:predicted acyl esterase